MEQQEDPVQVGGLRCLVDDCLAVVSGEREEEPLYFSSNQFRVDREQQQVLSINHAQDSIAQLQAVRAQQRPIAVGGGKGSGGSSRLMAVGQWDEALAAMGEGTAAERHRLMALLTYLAEGRPEQRGRYVTRAYHLAQRFPMEHELQSLLQRISSETQWKKVEQVQGGAGLRLIPLQSWLPENPSLRIRKALVTTRLDNHEILADEDPLVLTMDNLTTTELEVSWKLSEVSYLRPEEMDIVYRLDEQQQKQITLGPDRPYYSVRLSVPAGRHRLVTAIMSRYSNQFLQVRFQEIIPTSKVPVKGIIWSPQVRERAFHVVTKDEPLYASIQGPAWIRVDELRQDKTFSRYQYVQQGWQTVEVFPEKDQGEMLARLYLRGEKSGGVHKGLSRETISLRSAAGPISRKATSRPAFWSISR